MTIYVPNAEETRCFRPSKNIKIQCGIEGNVMKKECSEGCSGKAKQKSNSRIFAKLAKISLGLRKFRNHSENFATIANIRNPTEIGKFR